MATKTEITQNGSYSDYAMTNNVWVIDEGLDNVNIDDVDYGVRATTADLNMTYDFEVGCGNQTITLGEDRDVVLNFISDTREDYISSYDIREDVATGSVTLIRTTGKPGMFGSLTDKTIDTLTITDFVANGKDKVTFNGLIYKDTTITNKLLENAIDTTYDIAKGIRFLSPTVTDNEFNGSWLSERITGTTSADILNGNDGDDYIDAGKGNDTVYGGDGDDFIEGKHGSDSINGGEGNDTLSVAYSLAGDVNIIYGGAGNDSINVLSSNDDNVTHIYAEEGNDNVVVNGKKGTVYLYDLNSEDTFIHNKISESEGVTEYSYARDGQDLLITQTNTKDETVNTQTIIINDHFTRYTAGTQIDAVTIGGEEISLLEKATVNVTVGEGETYTTTEYKENITVASGATINLVASESGKNYTYISLGELSEAIKLNFVDDSREGYQSQYDIPEYYWGEDSTKRYGIDKTNGSLTIARYTGVPSGGSIPNPPIATDYIVITDFFTSEHGKNKVIFDASILGTDRISKTIEEAIGFSDIYSLNMAEIKLKNASLTDYEGTWLSERITGTTAANNISGGDGDDSIKGGSGNDIISGDAGNDSLYGEAGNDSIFGGEGNDAVDGGAGNDIIEGGAGDDIIIGGAGTNTLTGDAGADTFVYYSYNTSHDTITDATSADSIRYAYADTDITDFTYTRKGDDLVIKIKNNEITLQNHFTNETKLDNIYTLDDNGDLVAQSILEKATIEVDLAQFEDGYVYNATEYKEYFTMSEQDRNVAVSGVGANDTVHLDELSLFKYDMNVPGSLFLVDGEHDDDEEGIKSIEIKNVDEKLACTIENKFGAIDLKDSFVTVANATEYSTANVSGVLKLFAGIDIDGTDEADKYTITKGYDYSYVSGGKGNDTISVSGNSAKIDAGDGDDDVSVNGNGETSVVGGKGNDVITLNNSGVNSLFYNGDNTGVDTVIGATSNDILKFAEPDFGPANGYKFSDLNFEKVNDDLVITVDNTENAVVLDKFFTAKSKVDAIWAANEYGLMPVDYQDNPYSIKNDATLTSVIADGGEYTSAPEYKELLTIAGSATLKNLTDKDVIKVNTNKENLLFERQNDNLLVHYTDKTVTLENYFKSATPLALIQTNNGNFNIAEAEITVNMNATNIHTYQGTDHKEYVFGTNAADKIYGNGGNDWLVGNDGNDVIYGGDGNDTIDGGLGNDQLYGGADNNTFTFIEGDGKDAIYSNGGNDTLKFMGIAAGTPFKIKENGNDVVIYYGNSDDSVTLKNYLSNDKNGVANSVQKIITVDPFNVETVVFDATDTTKPLITMEAEDYKDNIKGSTLAETLIGSSKNNTLRGGGGDDIIHTVTGNNKVYTDSRVGDEATVYVGHGNDVLNAGKGTDTYVFVAGHGSDTINANTSGTVIIDVTGLVGNNLGFSESGNDLIITNTYVEPFGATVAESITVKGYLNNKLTANIMITDDAGVSTTALNTYASAAGITIGNPLETKNQKLTGRFLDETLLGGAGNDVIKAGEGDDTVIAGAGNDTVYGGGGNDDITLLSGNNKVETQTLAGDAAIVYAGLGNDTLTAGKGVDTFVFVDGHGNDIVNANTNGTVILDVTGLTGVTFEEKGNDLIINSINGGTVETVTVKGYLNNKLTANVMITDDAGLSTTALNTYASAAGVAIGNPLETKNQKLTGRFLDEVLFGGAGNDVIKAGEGDDTVIAGAGNDTVYGGGGNDVINLISGNNKVYTESKAFETVEVNDGTGNDLFTAGNGTDTYIFVDGHGNDTVTANTNGLVILDVTGLTGVTFEEKGNDLIINSLGATETITVKNYLNNKLTGNLLITDNNGATLQLLDVYANASGITIGDALSMKSQKITGRFLDEELYGGFLNDKITSNEGRDTIIGGKGNDTLNGYIAKVGKNYVYNDAANAKEYVFDYTSGYSIFGPTYYGDGADTINNAKTSDVITMNVANAADAANLAANISYTKKGNNLIINYASHYEVKGSSFLNVTDSITISNYFALSNADRIDRIDITDGTTVFDSISLNNETLITGKGKISDTKFNDNIAGSIDKDTYTLTAGIDNVVDALGGDDTYNVKSSKNTDNVTLTDYTNSNDKYVVSSLNASVTIDDKGGNKDALQVSAARGDKAVAIFDVDAAGAMTANSSSLFVSSKNNLLANNILSGVEIKNHFDVTGAALVNGGDGQIETITSGKASLTYTDAQIDSISQNVSGWLSSAENVHNYGSVLDVINNGDATEIQTIVAFFENP